MNIHIIATGKTSEPYLQEGNFIYEQRLKRYVNLSVKHLPDIKNAASISHQELKEKEGQQLLKYIKLEDFVVLLDENGKTYSSNEFATYISKLQLQSVKNVLFVIGGAFGFSQEVYQRANHKIALSSMTFSHQMVRLFFTEQLYRAYTILNNEKYHHN